MILNLLLTLLLQTPVPIPAPPPLPGQTVLVGLEGGQVLPVQDPQFIGFIEGRSGDAVLMYHQGNFHGEMPLKTIARIQFHPYTKGKPWSMTVTLRNGQSLQVESERRDFVSVRGRTDFGTVLIKQPDPISGPSELGKPIRQKHLTIQYLEIPTS
jgi:hypothetical protein